MLTKCPECGAEISDSASKCPHCGKILKKPARGFWGKFFLGLFIGYNILMAAGLVSVVHGCSSEITGASSEVEELAAATGTTIGITFIVIIWAAGAIITGLPALLTRPGKR